MSSPIFVKADLGASGLAGSAGFTVYASGSYTTPVHTRAASVSGGTIAQVGASDTPPKTLYVGTFPGDPAASYDYCFDDGTNPGVWGEINPSVNVNSIENVRQRAEDGVASAVDATHITLDTTDANFAVDNAGKVVTILRATAGAGQTATVLSSNTGTGQQTIAAWSDGVTPTGTVAYEVTDLVPTTLTNFAFGTGAIVSASSPSVFVVTGNLSGLSEAYEKGTFFRFDTGAMAGLKRLVASYVVTSGPTITVTTVAFPATPSAGNKFTMV